MHGDARRDHADVEQPGEIEDIAPAVIFGVDPDDGGGERVLKHDEKPGALLRAAISDEEDRVPEACGTNTEMKPAMVKPRSISFHRRHLNGARFHIGEPEEKP